MPNDKAKLLTIVQCMYITHMTLGKGGVWIGILRHQGNCRGAKYNGQATALRGLRGHFC